MSQQSLALLLLQTVRACLHGHPMKMCVPPSWGSFNSPFEPRAGSGAVSRTVLAAVLRPLNDFWGQCWSLQA